MTTINEHEGVVMIAHPSNATPYEVDVARKFAEFIKTIKPPEHAEVIRIETRDKLDNFKNS